ncbi:hypothetical protein M1563_02785 [Patescibacteria group bacterium]|nr:hypothetical protein [Patescibacteria group bacterium]
MKRFERYVAAFFISYFFIGLLFASLYALFYHWSAFSFFSPGFYMVLLTWPAQLPGFFADFQYYGFAGKTLP